MLGVPQIHPNPLTSGGVIAGPVNIVETRHKVFAVFGKAIASLPSTNYEHDVLAKFEYNQMAQPTLVPWSLKLSLLLVAL